MELSDYSSIWGRKFFHRFRREALCGAWRFRVLCIGESVADADDVSHPVAERDPSSAADAHTIRGANRTSHAHTHCCSHN